MTEFDDFSPCERLARLPGEFLSARELELTMEKRFGLEKIDLRDLAEGEATVEKVAELDGVSRGMFAYSAEAFLTATSKEAQAKTWQNLWNDASYQLFEAVSNSGHHETQINDIDSATGDAIINNGDMLCDIYLRDLMMPSFKWRAKLSFAELMETAEVAELSRRGELEDKVYVNASCFPLEAPPEQVARSGYREENEKAFLRAQTDIGGKRVLQTLTYSHLRPEEMSRLAKLLDVAIPEAKTTKDALRQGLLVSKDVFDSIGGLAGLAGLVDGIKQRHNGQAVYFGDAVLETPAIDAYDNIVEVSKQRKERANEVTGQYVNDVLLAYIDFRNGSADAKTTLHRMGRALLVARNLVLMGDRELALEQHGEGIVSQIDQIHSLYTQNRLVEAMDAERGLQKALGNVYVCGLSIQVDVDGNLIGADGETLDCNEIKNGDIGTCPGCKQLVAIIVDPSNKEKLYCPRAECSLSRSGGREVKHSKLEADHDSSLASATDFLLKQLKNEQFSLAA